MSKRISIGMAEDFPADKLTTVNANGASILVARRVNRFYAVRNRCSHLPLPISGGKLEGSTITCPWHNSQFDICSGENLDWVRGVLGLKLPVWSCKIIALGKKPRSLTTYDVIEEDGKLFVEM